MKECAICYKKSNHVTKCGHHFCVTCIQKWSCNQSILGSARYSPHSQIKTTCPMCRQEITPPEYYHTRSEGKIGVILSTLIEKFSIQSRTRGEKETADVLDYIWENRVVLRKFDEFVDTVKNKIKQLRIDYQTEGITPPPTMEKLKNL